MSGEKQQLNALLNQCLQVRNQLKQSIVSNTLSSAANKQIIGQLKSKSIEAINAGEKLSIDHARALGMEFNSFAQFCEKNNEHSGKPATEEIELDEYIDILKQLESARVLALTLGDKGCAGRSLELMTNIYSITKEFDLEIQTIEKACQVDKNIPMATALLVAHLKKLDFIYQDRDRIYQMQNEDSDAFMKAHVNAWEQYLWLKDRKPLFNRDAFIHQFKAQLFKLAIYMGSLANPLISAKDKEVETISMEAFDEAFYIANLTKDQEYFCAATAHKSSVVYRTLPADERQKLLESLKKVESEINPHNSELRDLIYSIESKAPSLHPEMKENDPPPQQQQQPTDDNTKE